VTSAKIPRASGTLLSRTNWQMAPGERAALEGLLASTKPRLAIELGTAQGGSLERIAAHSEEVHTFDFDPQVDEAAFPNVTFHYGDIRILLPRVLAEFESAGRNVDFALIDADHRAAGVKLDLENVLNSGAVRETFIVMHDAMNEGVSSGIEAVDLARYPKVVFRDFGFVQLDPHARGLREIWGGLGLIVCDEGGKLDIPREQRERSRSLGAAANAGAWRALAPARTAIRGGRERLGEIKRSRRS
jgi:predicted O-methyltransferase YrrM